MTLMNMGGGSNATPTDAPDATPSSPENGGEASTGTNASTATDTDSPEHQESGPDFVATRPENVPEKFWDTENNKVRVDDVLKSYSEAEKALAKAREKPQAPETYELNLSEDIKNDFGLENIPDDDPYLSSFREFAKESGLTQEQHDEFTNWYVKTELNQGRERMIQEFAKLGGEKEATARIKALHQFGSKLSPEHQQVMSNLVNSSQAVEMFESIIKMSTQQRNPADANPSRIDQGLTQNDIDVMMSDERYSDKTHPEYHSWNKKVTEAFNRLYPSKKR